MSEKTSKKGPDKTPQKARRRSMDGPAVVAHTTEDDQYTEVRREAQAHAKAHGCVLILYAADAASLFADPMPNEWDSDGEVERFGDRLNPDDLEFLGRSAIADQVREGQRAYVKTAAWLPKDKGVEALAEYAIAQGAHIVFVPEGLDSVEGLPPLLAGGKSGSVDLQVVPTPGS